MPGGGLVLDRGQRDALRSEAAEELENVSAIAMAIRAREWERARTLREHFLGVMRLLDDLGWAPEDDGERFALTMPVGWLARVMRGLRGATARKLEDSIGPWTSEPVREAVAGWLLALRTSSAVLEAIADPEGGIAANGDEIVRRELGRMPIATDPIGWRDQPAEEEPNERPHELDEGGGRDA